MMTLSTRLLIGGRWCEAQGGQRFERRGPLPGTPVSQAAAAGAEEARQAADAAQAAFEPWAALGPLARRTRLQDAAAALQARQGRIAEAMMAETGASAFWAGFNVQLGADLLREAAALTTQVGGQSIPSEVPGSLCLAQRVPAGVVLGMAPWNAPVILAVRALATPLACGNTVVLKGSEICPATHALVAEALHEAGLGDGVVNYLCHAPDAAEAVTEALIAHDAVRRVNFTGSTRVGRLVARACAEHLKPSVLELGGKAPFVVLDDADLDDAVKAALFGAYVNAGQICMSTERLIVVDAVADEFVERLAARVRGLKTADPRHGPVALGAVVDLRTVERCNALLQDALERGARLVAGGPAESTLMPATLVDRVTPQMRLYHEETFGPLKGVVRVADTEAAIACANDTEYGLAAAVHGRDTARAWRVAQRIRSGICHVNGPTVHDEAQMPFGGVRHSGWGRFGGSAGVAEFTDLRWMSLQTEPRHYPFS